MTNKKRTTKTEITALKHKDKRANIPTEELRDFVAQEEKTPKKILYPRDTSLDPQLVWKGKDEQDEKPLEVPAVPVYIQEKIHPGALIEELRAESEKDSPAQADLFSDFNGLAFEKLVEFYQHKDGVNWANRMILGDSLLVMTSLSEKEGLKGKIQMIYFDPPYGIKFGSNWQVSTRKRDVKDSKADDATRQPEQVKAFRDTWQLGIHSYLSYMRDRLVTARELLTESGSIFVQIGDENVHLVRSLLDEVFGSENFFSMITFRKTLPLGSEGLSGVTDYLLWYAKNIQQIKFRELFTTKTFGEETPYSWLMLPNSEYRNMTKDEKEDVTKLPAGAKVFRLDKLTSAGYTPTCIYDFTFNGKLIQSEKQSWRTNQGGMKRLISTNRVVKVGSVPTYVLFHDDFPVKPLHNLWEGLQGASDPIYVVQTNMKVIERCLLMTTDPGDLVLDPTCGSGTTAYVAEQWGRRWLTIGTSRVALALARTRLMAAKYPYYFLADSPEGMRKEMEVSPSPSSPPVKGWETKPSPLAGEGRGEGDIKKGFVYKRVPHVTLKSIANNEEIDIIHAKYQEKLESVREQLNKLLKTSYQEWEIPREAEKSWNEKAKKLHEEWRTLKRERQKEIDASIAKRADTEILYDQPYEDNKRIRVTGPFTVESLSPHRVISDQLPVNSGQQIKTEHYSDFVPMILENLKKAGVQTTRKDERLKFDSLEPYAGVWLHAEGKYTEKYGKERRVAVSIGPEHGTVGPEQVKEAAKEALKGRGFDVLIVCGFAFDAHAGETAKEFSPEMVKGKTKGKDFIVAEETKQYGKLPVLLARMNPDLTMGDELLKKTGAGNLFMVFGEPDVSVVSGQWLVTRSGRMIANYEHVKELSGLGSLEEINRAGRKGLSGISKFSSGGEVWANKPDEEGGGFRRGEHRRGRGEGWDTGVPSVSGSGKRLIGGVGDIPDSGGKAEAGFQSGHNAGTGASSGSWADAQWSQALAALQSLSDADFPLSLTTGHWAQVTVHGVDVYDPTTGEIRSSATDDIACWFIDTNYNGESFFVRHAYFTGAEEPYERLKRALRAEVDEAAWAALYATVSRPFDAPKTGKIAVKVINHYGDEVLKVVGV